MNVLITGAAGQVGHALVRARWPDDAVLHALTRTELDLCDGRQVDETIARVRPDIVVNAAAYTDVDRAERERDVCTAVNSDAVARLAQACANGGAALIHISSDFVFQGTRAEPYREDDPVNPLNHYARTKADAEIRLRVALARHVILRTSWVFSPHGRNFLTTMLRLAREGREIRVVADRFGCPTPASYVADAIVAVIAHMKRNDALPWGTYHYCGAGPASWLAFAQAIFAVAEPLIGRPVDPQPIAGSDFPSAAARPDSTILDCTRIAERFGIHQKPWIDALPQLVQEAIADQESAT